MAILEVIVGMVFTFLLLSLLGTTVNELIAAWRGWRGFYLEEGLRRLLSQKGSEKVFTDFVDNPFYRQLLAHDAPLRVSRAPAYLSGVNFTSILANVLKEKGKVVEQIDDLIAGAPEGSDLRKVMEQFRDEGHQTVEEYKARLQEWFDDVMAQASGWYKRHLQIVTLLVGLVIAAVFNADSFEIYAHLTENTAARKEINALAEKYVRENPTLPPVSVRVEAPQPVVKIETPPAATDSAAAAAAKPPAAVAETPPAVVVEPDTAAAPRDSSDLEKLLASETFQKTSNILGLGWSWKDLDVSWRYWLRRILGWLITALAISMGAAFWFDVLKKIITIRSSGGASTSGEGSSQGGAQVVINTGKTTTVAKK